VAIALLAFVLPPVAAMRVQSGRVAKAQAGAEDVAQRVADNADVLSGVRTKFGDGAVVVTTDGAAPKFETGGAWPEVKSGGLAMLMAGGVAWSGASAPGGRAPASVPGASAPASVQAVAPASASGASAPADPWGNQYLVVVAAGRGSAVVSPGRADAVTALSAGPNGIVETPFADLSRPRGDDIAATRSVR
jgi:hypothetical protein